MDEHGAVAEQGEKNLPAGEGFSMTHLPDHVVMIICQHLEPFDLLSLGGTCRHFHKLTSSRFMWTSTALSWCHGLWHDLPIDAYRGPEDPKQWLFHLLRLLLKVKGKKAERIEKVPFENGEMWLRTRNNRFACKVAMLAQTYEAINRKLSPFVLQRVWLYDIGLFKRLCPRICFNVSELNLDPTSVSQLAKLGRARSNDLRGQKQPNINACNYVSRKPSSSSKWSEDLFPHGPNGSICPMLVCPSTDGYAMELSGLDGLVKCVSYVLEHHLACACLRGQETLVGMAAKIRQACDSLEGIFKDLVPVVEAKWPSCSLAHAITSMSEQGWPDLSHWDGLEEIGLQWREVMSRCAALVKEYGTLDAIADEARIRWRRSLLPDIEAVLGHCDKTFVSRINLTDCDALGGDNSRQNMAAAAFVSPCGVMVTWQVLGKASY
ncbi:hypothetical protein HPB50_027438 [Hyalomma asiaticum]|uniref:Uncharacterized protein n=1 Tax=Hyalomma asiaticum TaxID=266040 RepID=A0ACB7SHQ4_HYAAI|nr:hypothetical protein HPB50_027438 [Hyalomma asiaticum]